MKKQRKYYYVALNKAKNSVIVSQTKTIIADFVGICTRTILRNMINTSVYDTESFTIWSNITIPNRKTGFALRKRYVKN